jgi:hypothetical protein
VHFGVMSSLIECWQIEAFVQVDSKVLWTKRLTQKRWVVQVAQLPSCCRQA